MKLAQIKNNKVIAFFNDNDELPDNSHFVNVDKMPDVEIGTEYKNGLFDNENLAK